MPHARLVIALMGPTASGKSNCALALARHLPIEIISVDSAQVYRGMDIGTAKPSPDEQRAVTHHLIDCVEPTEAYSAARFVLDADKAIDAICARGHVPVLAGGTMLYFKALREGLSSLPAADPAVRAELESEARQIGWPALHARLQSIDPTTAARLDPNDAQRIQRALEICLLSGEPMSQLIARTRPVAPRRDHWLQMALVPSDRAALHARIAARFDRMLAHGLVAELAALRERHVLNADLPAMRSVGYRQAWLHLEGAIDRAELRERGIHATRQLAKRQLTWLRSTTETTDFDCLSNTLEVQVVDKVLRHIDLVGSTG